MSNLERSGSSKHMKIEAVTVCVGCADFLRESAKANAHHFDRWVIVTSKADHETFAVCREFNLPCLQTDDFYRDGDAFNKGRAIQRGINALSCAGWVLQLDADIILPHLFRQAIGSAELDPAKIYGADRQRVVGWPAWVKVRDSDWRQHSYHCYVRTHPDHEFGHRWASPTDGYVPIGYFQLFHGSAAIKFGVHQKPYMAHHSNAARGDVQFAMQWDRRDRELLAEVIVWHLESEPAKLGANWSGRTTCRFGPPPSK